MTSAECRVLVVRDGERETLRNPPPEVFGPSNDVSYRHVADQQPLTAADHYIFHCNRIDERLFTLSQEALTSGGRLTFIVRHMSPALAAHVRRTGASLVPSYGFGEQVTLEVLRGALREVLAGRRVVASGFATLSTATDAPLPAGSESTFIDLIREASWLANRSVAVVAAVLALHRTGSNFMRDLIGLSVSGAVNVFHEHEVPPLASAEGGSASPLFELTAIEPDPTRARQLRRAILRHTILDAGRRFIFVTEREPEDRLISYFQRRHFAWLRTLYEPTGRLLRDAADLQRRFDEWLEPQIQLQRRWYRERLLDTFGLDVLRTRRTHDGLLLGQHAENTVVIVTRAQLTAISDQLASTFETTAYGLARSNTLKRAEIGKAIDHAFRQQITVPAEASATLWSIPEVAHIHGAFRAPRAPS